MELISNPNVEKTIQSYPEKLQQRIRELRALILDTASETEGLSKLEETLKWGEPSYLTKNGSTIRIACHPKRPGSFSIFFKCTSQLAPTFRMLYPDIFEFDGNREIFFSEGAKIPKKELKHCIRLALTYHKVKHLPMLGA
ncbi:DUF1801 domain-containing protein [Algoriphagus namhaensis]|uniref:DUF1801 domain-containing protein n=1 Tax=Algoriphagus namhaensis TaxID=915353 RepID=A0ABV8ANT7_9BACT